MRKKNLAVRFVWLAVVLGILIPLHQILKENSYLIAERHATVKYVPPDQEQIYKRAGVPCIRPPGKESGCQSKAIDARPTDTLDAFSQSQQEKIYQLGLYLQRAEHKEAYDREHVFPFMETLKIGFDVGFGILYTVIGLLAGAFFINWFIDEGSQKVGSSMEKFSQVTQVPHSVKEFSAKRKLRQVQEEFQTLKNLHENGLITEEMFLKRKEELQSTLGKSDAFN